MAGLSDILSPFQWGSGGARLTPEQAARQREIASSLMQKGNPAFNDAGWLGVLGRGLEGGYSGWLEGKANRDVAAGQAEVSELFNSLLGRSPDTSTAMATAPAPDYASARVDQAHGVSGPQAYRDAIASIESKGSGDYTAVGPTHSKLGRALGRYQVMEANIGPWSEKHLGRRVTADEFMANPAIQDAIFDAEFGSYVDRFGDPAMAAQAWFAGPGGVSTNRKDSLGTSVPEYASKFNAALARLPAVAANEAMVAGSLAGVPVAETEQEILAQEAAMAAQDPMAFQQTPPQMGEPRTISDRPIADVAQSLAGLDLNSIPVTAGGNAGALPPGQPFPQPQPQMPSMQQLMQVASHPYASDAQRQIAGALIQQQMQAQDPYKQAQLEKLRLETEALRNPEQKPIEVGGVLLDPTTMQPIFDSRQQATPASIQEYQFYADQAAQAGQQPMPYDQWDIARRQSGATQVNVGGEGQRMGPVPAGMAAVEDPTNPSGFRLEMIPGSQAWLDANAASDQQDVQTVTDAQKAETTLDATRSVLDILDKAETPATGTLSRPFAMYSGSPAGKIRSYVGTLQSGVALGAMQRLKEASATGATGFGSLSAPELNLLINDIGALDPDNTEPEIFRKTIERIQDRSERVAKDIIKNVSPERIQELGLQPFIESFSSGTGEGNTPAPGAVVDGYRFKGGDPADPNSWEKQ